MTITKAWGVEYNFHDGETFTNDVYIDFDDAQQAVIDHVIIMWEDYVEYGPATFGELLHTWACITWLQQNEEPEYTLFTDLNVTYCISPAEIHHPSKHTGGTA